MDEEDDDDDGDFDRPAGPRENEAHDNETGVNPSSRDFDEDEREVFGFNSGMYFPRNGRGEDEYFGEAEQQSIGAPASVVSDQRRGHRNRETSSASSSQAASESVRGRFDPDTQGFNLDVGEYRRVPASTISSIALPPETPRAPRAPSTRSSKSSSARASSLPTKQSQLPNTREEFDALAKRINASGGINGSKIQVYAGSSLVNIRKNFIKRLGLAGKY
jgi:hypothetical protein